MMEATDGINSNNRKARYHQRTLSIITPLFFSFINPRRGGPKQTLADKSNTNGDDNTI